MSDKLKAYHCDECEILLFFDEDIEECRSEGHEPELLPPRTIILNEIP